MTETESGRSSPPIQNEDREILEKLVFSALQEQRRARRWGVFFKMFFVVYLIFITAAFMPDRDAWSDADGEKHTAVVKLTGVISSGKIAGSENVISGLRAAFEHDDTAGVVLEINSPGGSPVQSAYIYDEIMRLKQKHPDVPVYAVVSDIAASGGYFVAAAADQIYVNKSSLVGSIGVRLDSFGFVDMMDKMGIERRLMIAGDNKALLDPFLPENSEQKAHLQITLNQVHRHFIEAVKKGRGEKLVSGPDIFSGLIWSGEQSLELGLADAYGTTREVARQLQAEELVNFNPDTKPLEWVSELLGSSITQPVGDFLRHRYLLY